MFKTFTASFFQRRQQSDAICGDRTTMTRSELQDLFRNEFETHNRAALEITARQGNRRPDIYAA